MSLISGADSRVIFTFFVSPSSITVQSSPGKRARPPPVIQTPPAAPQPLVPRSSRSVSSTMSAAVLRLCVLLGLQLGRAAEPRARTVLEELLPLTDPLRPAAAAAPHRKAPQFMLELFDAVSAGNRRSQKEVLDGNVVRSFEDKGREAGNFHFFNLSSFSREEKMIKAELRWFRRKLQPRAGKSRALHFYKVSLWEVLDSRVRPWRTKIISSRLVPLHTHGWEVFNVTQIVSRWIRNPQENHGVLVVTSEVSSANQTGDLRDTNAYLVIFSDDGGTGVNQSYQGLAPPSAAAQEPRSHLSRMRRASSDPPARPQSCRRVPLFVDFDEIGWSGWIISPRGYNAYHCRGSCPFPLGVGLGATNHATVRSILHALRIPGSEVGAPCCVPDRLQSISLLYFDDEENVVLKQYDDMVALSCGCH
ncbi:bone morphogenetic protein 2 [Oryzias melastigma]|uniref:bone morphogenetic protein 2 n=1 Tax=Oryzias melastigma TaxID=30732 RepID=UPI00168D6559|nr:bone morphogenetic protein 2 [Oryzias melastigma]